MGGVLGVVAPLSHMVSEVGTFDGAVKVFMGLVISF